ncbi:hypothetical protein AB3S75_025621 [Citrus x aurantiifolia]
MMPVYVDSCHHQRNQMPFPHYYHPSHDIVPPHMMMDHSIPPLVPSFSYFSPAPPFYYRGHHPPFIEPYSVHYAPPPHHAMEQQRYEYDKDAHRDHHCCGCLNQMSNQRIDKGVKIEEQESDVAKKRDSVVPLQSKRYPYPIAWIPPEYEARRHFESEVPEPEKVPCNTESNENMKPSEGKPSEWNGWFPLDMNSLKSLMQGEDEKRKQNQQNENGMKQFSYPVICMPSNSEQREPEKKDQRQGKCWLPLDTNSPKSFMYGEDDKRRVNQQDDDKIGQFPYPFFWMPFQTEEGEVEKKDRKEKNASSISAEESPFDSKFMQVKPPESDERMKKSEANKDFSDDKATSSQMMEGTANHKIIPVRQVEMCREDHSDSAEKGVAADNASRTSKMRQSSSPPKTSKLPPVCLRLEPLSKQKNGNGNSRSPSPPGLKRQSDKDPHKPSASSGLKESTPQGAQSADDSLKTRGDGNPKKTEKNAVGVVDGKNCENKNEHLKSGSDLENSIKLSTDWEEDVTRKSSTVRNGKAIDGYDLIQDKKVRSEEKMAAERAAEEDKLNDSAESVNGECMAKEKNLSDDQAAVFIQSAYRGFEVRKSEPLKKLKQMVEVREQAAEIRKCIQALESSSDLLKNEKERLVIGEMIMRTLLKLDTIQGLHPSLRDIRKALAKDLVTLQEELDSIAKVAGDTSIDISDDAENSLKTSHDNVVDMKVPDEDNLSSMGDLVVNSQGLETSETALGDTEVQGRCEVRELPLRNSMESQVGESASDMVRVEATNGRVDISQAVLTENQEEDIMHPQLQQTSSEESTGAQLQDSCDEPKAVNEAGIDGVNGGIHVKDNLEAQATELSLKLDDEEQPLQELKNSESSRKGKSENVDGEVKLQVLAASTLPADVDNVDEIGKTARNVDSEINLAAELPIGALEEDLSFENKGSETNSETTLVAELPVGVLVGVLAIENKESEIENLVAELPVGVLEEGEAKESEIGKDKGSSIGEASYNVVTNTTTATELKDIMVDELSGNAVLGTEENPPVSSIEGEVRSDDGVCEDDGGRVDDYQLPSPESAGISVSSQALEVTNEDVQQQGVDGNKEGRLLEKEQQYGEPESMIDIDSRMDEASGSEITTEDTIAATITSQMSADEKDIVMEENAKLREMMEKLMEAGKEQLTVISQLTGRVKDLERKLSRKRKLRGPRRYKRATQSFR